MSIKLVVFDMAGTTVSDKNYVAVAFQRAMDKYGYQVELETINPVMGYEKPTAIKMMLEKLEATHAKISPQLIDLIHTAFVDFMVNFYTTADIHPLPNVESTFYTLREMGLKIGLDTGFSRKIASVIIDRLKWHDKIDSMIASDDVSAGRPFPYMIQKIMTETGIEDPTEVIKVGDTEVDINEGLNAGCQFVVGITTGSFTRQELEPYSPTHIIDDIAEVIDIVK